MEHEQQQQPNAAPQEIPDEVRYKREGWVCLNKHSHPASTKCCSGECCMMCCGYCSPTGVAVLVAALIIAQWVYHFIIMANYPSAWKIVVSIIIMLLIAFFAAAVLYAYYMVIFTSPGYVPSDPWKFPPRYVGPAPLRQEGTGGEQQQQQQGDGVGQTPLPHPVYGNLNPLMDERPLEEQNRREGGSDNNNNRNEAEVAVPLACRERHSPFSTHVAPTNGTGTGSTPVEIGINATKEKQAAVEGGAEEPMSSREGNSNGNGNNGGGGGNPYTVTQLDRGGHLRYCVKCQQYKPDSAHHCHVCGRCIFYFDHHCSWINNCVGRNNYKLFVVFVQYGAIACVICAGLSVIGVFAMDEHEMGHKIGWIAIPAVMLILGLTLSIFRMNLWCQLRKGQTTLESIIASENRNNERRTVGGYFGALKRKRAKTAEEKQQEKVREAERAVFFREEMLGPNPRCPKSFLPIPVRTDDTAVPTASLLKED